MTGDASSAPAPGSPVSDPINVEAVLKLTYRDGSGVFHGNWPIGRIDEAVGDKSGLLWVDILGPDEHAGTELQDWLCHHFQFHHLAVEDALSETHIAKVDDWGEYLYLVFHVAGFEPDSDKLDLHELDIFLGLNYLVTYHTAPWRFSTKIASASSTTPAIG